MRISISLSNIIGNRSDSLPFHNDRRSDLISQEVARPSSFIGYLGEITKYQLAKKSPLICPRRICPARERASIINSWSTRILDEFPTLYST